MSKNQHEFTVTEKEIENFVVSGVAIKNKIALDRGSNIGINWYMDESGHVTIKVLIDNSEALN
jgi:hypothetical protein